MKRFLGLMLLLIAILVAGAYSYFRRTQTLNVVTVHGSAGSEKIAFLENPEVRKYLRNKHGLVVDVQKAGSVEMVHHRDQQLDFLWPGSQVNVEMFREAGGNEKKVESIFHSPIVLYSWAIVTDALIQHGLVEKQGDTYYLTKPGVLFRMIVEKKAWKEIGLDQLYGNIIIKSTNPTRSNSGNMYAALLANSLNENQVVAAADLPKILPQLEEIFQRQGHMEHSSGVLFNAFLDQGVGAYPLIVGYENQLVEFSLQNREAIDLIRSQLRIIYPRPTVWASHPFIATSDKGVMLLKALQDEALQKIAWEQHGFRSGGIGAENDPEVLSLIGLPKSITAVMSTPNAAVMDQIIQSLP